MGMSGAATSTQTIIGAQADELSIVVWPFTPQNGRKIAMLKAAKGADMPEKQINVSEAQFGVVDFLLGAGEAGIEAAALPLLKAAKVEDAGKVGQVVAGLRLLKAAGVPKEAVGGLLALAGVELPAPAPVQEPMRKHGLVVDDKGEPVLTDVAEASRPAVLALFKAACEQETQRVKAEAEAAKLKQDARDAEIKNMIKAEAPSMPGGERLFALLKAADGKPEFAILRELFKGVSAALEKSALFVEIGSGATDDGAAPLPKLEAMVKAAMDADKNLTKGAAWSKVCREHPDLYAAAGEQQQ
jgi:hypothetical protein